MKLTITTLEPYTGEVEIKYPTQITDSLSHIAETTHLIGPADAYGRSHDIFLDDIWLSFSEISIEQSFKFRLRYNFHSVLLQFLLSGNQLNEFVQDSHFPLSYYPNQYNIVFIPNLEAYHEHAPSKGIEIIRIHIKPELFLRLLPGVAVFDCFSRNITDGKIDRLSESNLPVTPAMLIILRQIQNLQSTGFYKRWMIEAKVTELLMLQFEQYERSKSHISGKAIRKKDIEQMHHVKDIIMNNTHSPCSLIDLAHQVGTNEFHLKKAFKEVFGTTVFGYLQQVRMEEAQQLLLAGDMSISQIALDIGYKNANHFSAAYKKQFGYSPSELRKKN